MQSNFYETVSATFAFLQDVGFSREKISPLIVRYNKGELEADVFMDNQSYEVGFQIGYGLEKYSTSELIRLIDIRFGNEYRDYSARDHSELVFALERLAGLITKYGQDEISGDASVFSALKQQRQSWSENYALEVLADQVRPKAETAFRNGDYDEAAELYRTIEKRLSRSELRKLAIAQKRCHPNR